MPAGAPGSAQEVAAWTTISIFFSQMVRLGPAVSSRKYNALQAGNEVCYGGSSKAMPLYKSFIMNHLFRSLW
jgi:hypothetical protein